MNTWRVGNFCTRISHNLSCMSCGLLHYSVAQFRVGPLFEDAHPAFALQSGQLICSCNSSGKRCRINEIWQGVMALFDCQATLTMSRCHQGAVAEDRLAGENPPCPRHCRLFGRLESTLVTGNHLNGNRSLIHNLGASPLADSSVYFDVFARRIEQDMFHVGMFASFVHQSKKSQLYPFSI